MKFSFMLKEEKKISMVSPELESAHVQMVIHALEFFLLKPAFSCNFIDKHPVKL
jgi:hypothetical protein